MRQRAVRAVCDREAMASTAIVEIGVSVPHARLEGVAGVIAALAATPTALYYATAGVPISIMVLVFSAPDMIGEHLDTLASISLLLQSPTLRRNVEHAADAAAALRTLRGQNGHAAAEPRSGGRRAVGRRARSVSSRSSTPIGPEKDGARWPSRSSKPRGRP